ncbi:MAG: glycosyltransferase family 4 protein [Treponema sp.]|nr:glycosyltransferase family 4 protein [Treponema sp.]
MKVGIDTFGCNHGRSGLGSYLSSLTAHLQNTEDMTYELYGAEIDRYIFGSENNLAYKAVHTFSERAWHLFCSDNFAHRQKYDAVLYTAGARLLPAAFRVPGVAVVNDVVSNLLVESKTKVLSGQIKRSLKKADRIIVASQYIRKDLERLGVNNEKIVVVHNGINHSLFYPQELLSPNLVDIKPFAIQRPYFIFASSMNSSSKKHVELIKAFTLFKNKTRLPHRLVLAGSEGAYSSEVHAAAFSSHAASDIFITGFFPHESFPALYSGSDGCIFPAVGEGVGLPVLEAMATGVPVACAKSGALPEVAGNNALYFDADNIEEIAAAMETIALDKAVRERLIAGGIEWTKRFSWEKTAEKTAAVLKEAAENR